MTNIEYLKDLPEDKVPKSNRKTSSEVAMFMESLSSHPHSWAVFSRHASPAAASGRKKQVQEAKRYADYPIEWSTRRMPTAENPNETALTVQWVGWGFVLPLIPPPAGSAVIDPDGSPWVLCDIDGELTWAGIVLDESGHPKAKKITHDGNDEQVSQFRVIYTPPEETR